MAFSSGCGGPEYDWTDQMEIEIGGAIPRRTVPDRVLGYRTLIYDGAEKYNLPPHFIAGIMSFESGGDPDAGSPAGAMGLMQLIHSTAEQMAGQKLTTAEIYEPERNVDLGCKFLRQLWDRYKGDPIKIAFGYNAGSARCGSGCVRDYQTKGRPCIAACTPNQFNLVADCYKNGVTVDYGGIVAGYANDALLSGEFPIERPDGAGTGGDQSRGWLTTLGKASLAVGAGLFVMGGYLWWQEKQRHPAAAPPLGYARNPLDPAERHEILSRALLATTEIVEDVRLSGLEKRQLLEEWLAYLREHGLQYAFDQQLYEFDRPTYTRYEAILKPRRIKRGMTDPRQQG
ncbi:MAG: transglycosylase SLT domain-containing protein [Rhodanobacteraceae bacterium]|nr:transglycosylase SLT domain-containing protein [Rhodanobacteraceae bacterium]